MWVRHVRDRTAYFNSAYVNDVCASTMCTSTWVCGPPQVRYKAEKQPLLGQFCYTTGTKSKSTRWTQVHGVGLLHIATSMGLSTTRRPRRPRKTRGQPSAPRFLFPPACEAKTFAHVALKKPRSREYIQQQLKRLTCLHAAQSPSVGRPPRFAAGDEA